MKRQPKGTPVGGQFAEDRRPESADLPTTTFTQDDDELAERLNRVDCLMQDYEQFGPSALEGEMSFIHSTLEDARDRLGDEGTYATRYQDETVPAINHEEGTFNFGDHHYQFEKNGPENDVTNYVLTNAEGGGGWRFEYDSLTRRVEAHGVAPVRPSAEWRDKGEADIRTVVRMFEPNAKLVTLDRDTYLIGGNPWPLNNSYLIGISTGQMMLVGGKSEEELRNYIAQQRSDLTRSEAERPDMAESFNATRAYIEGIEIAADLGEDAAQANTVGVAKARFG